MQLCETCDHKKYGYSDGFNEVWICYNPLILLELIKENKLESICCE